MFFFSFFDIKRMFTLLSVKIVDLVGRLCFYPTALKGCQGIVLTHCVRLGGRVDGRQEKFVRAVSQKP